MLSRLAAAATAMADGRPDRPGGAAAGFACFALFVAAWTAYGAIADAGKSLHGDVLEAYAWGREFRLGYNQHPPFWAWIAGLWFLVFPRVDWAFKLLAVLNAAVGLAGAWRLIGAFVTDERRRAAFALLLVTPLYTFMAYKYNANTIFLSLWPWTLFAFCRAIGGGRRRDAVWFGVLLGAAFLSKYYAVVLAVTCVAASLVHPRRNAYWRSALPWISIAVCALCVLPHLIWLASGTAPPVEYAEGLVGRGALKSLRYAADFVVSSLLLQIGPLAVIGGTALGARRGLRFAAPSGFLCVLALLPVLLTALLGLALELKISSNMAVGIFPLVPLLLLQAVPSADPGRVFRVALAAFALLTVSALLAAPLIAGLSMRVSDDPGTIEPRKELAAEVTRLWHEHTGRRLTLAAATPPFDNAIAFYSPDAPSSYIGFSRIKAPWVTPERLSREGLMVACLKSDGDCHRNVERLLTPQSLGYERTLRHRFRDWQGPPMTFDLFVIPPRG